MVVLADHARRHHRVVLIAAQAVEFELGGLLRRSVAGMPPLYDGSNDPPPPPSIPWPMILPPVQAALTLGPVSMSLPDLAMALTKAGMPTECAPSLRDRAALVSLHGRSPEMVRRVLAEGLGIEFKKENGRWRMLVDDAAKAQDARLLGLYKAHVAKAAGQWAKGEQEARGGQGYTQLLAQANARALGMKDPARESAVVQQVTPIMALARRAQPNAWAAVAALRDPAFVGQAVEKGAASRTIPATSLENATGVPLAAYAAEAQRQRVSLAQARSFTTTLKFDPLRGTLTASSHLLVGDKALGGAQTFEAASGASFGNDRSGYETTIRLEDPDVAGTFEAMGGDATAFYRSLSPDPVLPEKPVLSPAPWTLSLALERLCAGGGDVVMALSPRFEYVPRQRVGGDPAPATSFRSAFDPKPGGFDAVPDYGYAAREEGLDAAALAARRAGDARRRLPWRVADRDGVWLVVNPFGFLDRIRPVSPVPFLQVEEAFRAQAGVNWPKVPVPTVATARRILRAMPLARFDELHEFWNYRDLGLDRLSPLLTMVGVVDGADPYAQAAFWRELREKGKAEISGKSGTIYLEQEDQEDPSIVGGYLFPNRQREGGDLGYVQFDGRGSVWPYGGASSRGSLP